MCRVAAAARRGPGPPTPRSRRVRSSATRRTTGSVPGAMAACSRAPGHRKECAPVGVGTHAELEARERMAAWRGPFPALAQHQERNKEETYRLQLFVAVRLQTTLSPKLAPVARCVYCNRGV